MNKDKATAIIYHDWSSIVRGLPKEQAGELFQGLFARWDGEDDGLPATLKVILDYFETKIDESNAKYDEAVKARAEGRKKQAEELKQLKETSSDLNTLKDTSSDLKGLKRPDTDTDTDTVTDTVTDTDIKENVSKDTSKKNFSLLVDEVLDSVELFKNNDDLKDAFKDYLEMRKQIKKPIKTKRALKLNLDDAIKFGNGDHDQTLEVINASIKHSWQGIYGLDNKKTKDDELMETIMNFGGDDIGE